MLYDRNEEESRSDDGLLYHGMYCAAGSVVVLYHMCYCIQRCMILCQYVMDKTSACRMGVGGPCDLYFFLSYINILFVVKCRGKEEGEIVLKMYIFRGAMIFCSAMGGADWC